jgi:hypothetical protein
MTSQHGGRRDNHKRRPDDKRGGARKGAGRRKRKHTITIRETAAQSIKIVLLARGTPYTPDTVAAWVEEQAERAWREYDQGIQAAADEAYEGGVL